MIWIFNSDAHSARGGYHPAVATGDVDGDMWVEQIAPRSPCVEWGDWNQFPPTWNDNFSTYGAYKWYFNDLKGAAWQEPEFTRIRDVDCGDTDDDGADEIIVPVDRSLWIDDNTSEPYLSLVEVHQGDQLHGDWADAAETERFVGSPRKLSAGQFDADANEEFVVANLVDNGTASELRIYDDNLTLMATSTSVPGRITAMELHDFDGDAIDEIIVGRMDTDGQNSTVMIYDASGALLDESASQTGYFTGLGTIPIPAPPDAPTTCTEVWSMGYGMQTDLDQSCKIDWGDFSVFASNWLATDCGNPADFDNSACSGGKVDWGDFSIFASTWLDCNDPTNMPPCIANW